MGMSHHVYTTTMIPVPFLLPVLTNEEVKKPEEHWTVPSSFHRPDPQARANT